MRHSRLFVAAIAVAAVCAAGVLLTPSWCLPHRKPIADTYTSAEGSRQDCGPRALLIAADEMGVKPTLSLDQLCCIAHIPKSGGDGASMTDLTRAAHALGIAATGVQMDQNALASLPAPALAWVDGDHYIAVLKVATDLAGVIAARIHDPNKPTEEVLPLPELLRRSGGVLLLLD